MIMVNEDCVLNAPKVGSLILKANTIVTEFKVSGDVIGVEILRLPREFLSMNL